LRADAVLALHLVNGVDARRVIEDAFGQRRLARIDVGRDADVADFGQVGQHKSARLLPCNVLGCKRNPALRVVSQRAMHFGRLAQAVCYPEATVECLDDNAASEFVSGALATSALTKVEAHLASCRDCRALVAALAGDEADSNAATHKHEK